MAVTQSVYSADYQVGFPGMPATQEVRNRISRTIADAGGIGFGRAAFQGAGDATCTGTPAAGKFLGITLLHYAPMPNPTTGAMGDSYPQYAPVPIETMGPVWVTNGAAAVVARDQAYVTPAGAFTNVATGNVILPGWFFETSGAAGALVQLVKR